MTPVLRWSNGSRLSRHEREREKSKRSIKSHGPPSRRHLVGRCLFIHTQHFLVTGTFLLLISFFLYRYAPARSSFHSPPLAFSLLSLLLPHLAIHSSPLLLLIILFPKCKNEAQRRDKRKTTTTQKFSLSFSAFTPKDIKVKQETCNYFRVQSRKETRTFFFFSFMAGCWVC